MPPANDNAFAAPVPSRARGWRGVHAAVLAWGRHVHAHTGAHGRVVLLFGASGAALALLQHGALR